MTSGQFIGWTLNNSTAVTSLLTVFSSVASIFHGMRPGKSDIPCINYYTLSSTGQWDIESEVFSINCRASTAEAARAIAKAVKTLFIGANGKYGTNNSFDVAKTSLSSDNGLIIESENEIYNAPIDLRIVYRIDTIS